MPNSASAVTAEELALLVGMPHAPLVFDVRRAEAFAKSERMIAGARWRDHGETARWGRALPLCSSVVLYCVHGHQVSQGAAARLRSIGLDARFLAGGFEAYLSAGGVTLLRDALPLAPDGGASRWITRESPKIGRLACTWFIRRFLDREAEILCVEPTSVEGVADEFAGEAFGIDDAELCDFDRFLERFGIEDERLRHVARIVRGADAARTDLEPQCAGLLALELGISALHGDDPATPDHGFALYDALFAWARQRRGANRERPIARAS